MDKPVHTKTRCKQKRTPLQQDETIRRSHMKGQRFRKKISDKMTDKETDLKEYDINKKPLHIYCISDTHIGSNVFNKEYFEYALNMIKKDKHQKIIYLNGDILEVGSKSVGNSAFKQNINVNEQLETAIKYFEPLKDYICGVTKGNHDSKRLLKDFDFELTQVLADRFDCTSVSQLKDTLLINEEPYNVYATHGKGSAPVQPHLAYGKVMRETGYINADLLFYGHIHRAGSIQQVNLINKEYKRKTFVLTGHFLSYKDSYAEEMSLKPIPECFTRVNIDKDLNTTVTIFNIDETCPEMVRI